MDMRDVKANSGALIPKSTEGQFTLQYSIELLEHGTLKILHATQVDEVAKEIFIHESKAWFPMDQFSVMGD